MRTKIGVLLVNLGSPSAPTIKDTRTYLTQFLKDRRVIELTPLLWWPILYGTILRSRPAKSAKAYALIWDKDEAGQYSQYSTLVQTTITQAKAVQDTLQETVGDRVIVRAAMRYGQPSIEQGIKDLTAEDCDEVLIVPLYPQYAGATTGSVHDEVNRIQKKLKSNVRLKCTRAYHDHDLYISALASSLKNFLHNQKNPADKILVSFHGLPKSSIDKGDPYEDECTQTFKMMQNSLPDLQDKMVLTYQSRFGPKQWLTPYTIDVLQECAENGEKNIVLITPGFAADCLETLEELSIRAKEKFISFGGENLSLVPCLNAQADHIKLLSAIVLKNI
ncbi:MAG: ferrochelatase [Robiginitomaculum sp.]|nr:ferrochelatase [Robiginitomaculum sp.]